MENNKEEKNIKQVVIELDNETKYYIQTHEDEKELCNFLFTTNEYSVDLLIFCSNADYEDIPFRVMMIDGHIMTTRFHTTSIYIRVKSIKQVYNSEELRNEFEKIKNE